MGELIISSMCTGIGSFEMAMRNLKIPHISRFAIEIDKYAKQTFLANFETETMYDDMTTYDYIGDKWYSDLLVAGIPCQAFSLAGKRLGELDARGLLFYDFYRYVKNQQPKYFIIENVKGLLSMDKGNVFNNWKALLGQSENGTAFLHNHEDSLMYNLHWKVLNTKNYGLPQNRERVFLIGIRKDLPNYFVFPKEIPLELRLKDLLEESVDDKYYLKNMQDILFKTLKTSELCSDIEFIDAYNQKVYKDGTTNTINTRVDASNHSYIRVPNKSNKNDIIQISNNNKSNGGRQPYQQDRIYHSDGISPALSAHKSDLNITDKHKDYLVYDDYNSKLRTDGCIGTMIQNIGASARRNGQKIIEVQKDNVVIEQITKNINNGNETKTNAREILRILLTTVSEKTAEEWQSYVASAFQQNGLLQSGMHEESLFDKQSKNGGYNYSEQQGESTEVKTRRLLRNLWKGECHRCSSQRRESIKQLFRELAKALSVLPYKNSQTDKNMQSGKLQWESKGIRLLQQALYQIQEVRKSNELLQQNFRIRKLTPLEAFRLQGFPDDYVKPVSSSQLYKQAGNSISVPVIENILKVLLKNYIN